MDSYLKYVMLLNETFPVFELVHVPREQNARADLLAKLASLGKGGRQRSVIQEILKAPRTTAGCAREVQQVSVLEGRGRGHRSWTQETLKVPKVSFYGLSKEKLSDVCLIDVGETWMTPYRHYLVDGLLPAEPTEAKVIKKNVGRYTGRWKAI